MFTRFVANSEKCRKYAFLGGPPRLLRYYKGGVIEIYYNTTRGGSSRFITILQGGGGVSRDPKFVLRNIWTAPYILPVDQTKGGESTKQEGDKNDPARESWARVRYDRRHA